MWSGDIINAQYYLPKGVKPKVLSYWFPPDGKGMVDNDLMVLLAQGKNPILAHHFLNFMLDAKNATRQLRLHRLPAAAGVARRSEDRSPRLRARQPRDAMVKQEWFDVGYRLLELPPAADAAWHQIWQQFKAGA